MKTQTLDTHRFPNGGWQFRQPQTNWTNPMAMVGFDASVQAIVKHRSANKAISLKHNLSTNPAVVKDELLKFTRARLGIPEPSNVPFPASSSHNPSVVGAVAADIKRAAQGTTVALDWIQAGGEPVAQDLAERRAAICVACPKNVRGAWFTEAPANLLRSAIKGWQSLRGNTFAFETAQGDKLKSCDVCKCLMQLKVFCPLDHILQRTKPEIMAEFPPNCWIAKRDQ